MGLKTEDAYLAELRTVLNIAHALRDATAASHRPTHSPIDPRTLIGSIDLPSPRPLLPSLLEEGFSREIASSISGAYEVRAKELKRRIQESVITTSREIVELPMVALASSPNILVTKMVTSFTELYLRRLDQWKEEIFQRVEQATKKSGKRGPPNSRTFNQEYVPLLEHFFKENPFPTHADKMFLAKKSNMQYRQIHVWFQNRRSRTKKETKPLKKVSHRRTQPLDKSYKHIDGHTVPVPKVPKTSLVDSSGESEVRTPRNDSPEDSFLSTSPPHAFPSPYPSVSHYDPFPCNKGPIHFSRPEWRRTPCGKRPPPLSTSIDELVDRFSLLNVRGETHCKGSPRLSTHAATAAITVIPTCAPHPSLLLGKCSQLANAVRRHPIVRAGVSSSKAFRDFCSISQAVTLVPPSASFDGNQLPGKRKIAPLPRRFPDQICYLHRETAPSENSWTSSTSSRLCTPDFESQDSSSSSISLLSTPSDIASSRALPRSFDSPSDGPIQLSLEDMAAILSSVS